MINPQKVNGKSPFALAARANSNDPSMWCTIVEAYRDGSIEGREHLEFIFGKKTLIRLHEYYLNRSYGCSECVRDGIRILQAAQV